MEQLHELVAPVEADAPVRRDEELDDLGGAGEAHMPSVETVDDVGDLAVDLRLFSGGNHEEHPQMVLLEEGSSNFDPTQTFDVNIRWGHAVPSMMDTD